LESIAFLIAGTREEGEEVDGRIGLGSFKKVKKLK